MKDIKSLKVELKKEAIALRAIKIDIKTTQKKYQDASYKQSELLSMKWDFRHRFIAYCLMRGRTYKQVEKKCRVDPNHEWIQEVINEYTPQTVHSDS